MGEIQTMDIETLEKRMGGVNISDYVYQPTRINQFQGRLEKVSQKIEEMGGPEGTNTLPCERSSLNRLCAERAFIVYPELDLSFLDMTQSAEIQSGQKRESSLVPKFVVQPAYGLSRFNLEITYEIKPSIQKGFSEMELRVWFSDEMGPEALCSPVPGIFCKHFATGLGKVQESKNYIRNKTTPMSLEPSEEVMQFFIGLEGKRDGRYRKLKSLSISPFKGVVPTETRQRIKGSLKTFRRKDLYFIREAPSAEWDSHKLLDPLVVGITPATDKCYLIDKFDPTPLEEYVSQEFTFYENKQSKIRKPQTNQDNLNTGSKV